jgi:hypothetical protein
MEGREVVRFADDLRSAGFMPRQGDIPASDTSKADRDVSRDPARCSRIKRGAKWGARVSHWPRLPGSTRA